MPDTTKVDEDSCFAWDEQGERNMKLICEFVNNAKEIIAALEAAPVAHGEPVAWQFRIHETNLGWSRWKECTQMYFNTVLAGIYPDTEARALYLTTASQQPTQATRNAIEDQAKHIRPNLIDREACIAALMQKFESSTVSMYSTSEQCEAARAAMWNVITVVKSFPASNEAVASISALAIFHPHGNMFMHTVADSERMAWDRLVAGGPEWMIHEAKLRGHTCREIEICALASTTGKEST